MKFVAHSVYVCMPMCRLPALRVHFNPVSPSACQLAVRLSLYVHVFTVGGEKRKGMTPTETVY